MFLVIIASAMPQIDAFTESFALVHEHECFSFFIFKNLLMLASSIKQLSYNRECVSLEFPTKEVFQNLWLRFMFQ